MTHSSSLWAKVLKGSYFPRSSFWEAHCHSHDSWIWQGLLASRDVLNEGVRINIGDRCHTLFWDEPWVPKVVGFKLSRPPFFPLLVNLEVDLMIILVANGIALLFYVFFILLMRGLFWMSLLR